MTRNNSWESVSDLASERIFDSRDAEELREELQDKADAYKAFADDPAENPEAEELTEDEAELLAVLTRLQSETSSEWDHGIGFIREDEFEDYCRELASDCGYVKDGGDNPLMQCIDWAQWAELCQQDYSSTEIDGRTFYYRD